MRDHPRDLVLAVSVPDGPGKDRHDHVRPERPHHVHRIPEHLLERPQPQCFVDALRVAEVERAGEELLPAVQRACGEQLARADDAEAFVQPWPDQVLSAFAPAERQVRGLGSHSAREGGEQAGVLVIGVGGDHQDALHAVELPHAKRRGDDPARLLGAGGRSGPERSARDQADGCDLQGLHAPPRASHLCR